MSGGAIVFLLIGSTLFGVAAGMLIGLWWMLKAVPGFSALFTAKLLQEIEAALRDIDGSVDRWKKAIHLG